MKQYLRHSRSWMSAVPVQITADIGAVNASHNAAESVNSFVQTDNDELDTI